MNTSLVNNKSNGVNITQYDISVIPNDFNISTIFNLVDSGAIEMPFFQRNYIWDRKRASRFIESLVLGLPIPQIFLYQTARNKFLVIDGQQRLLSVYYFIKQRFPLTEKRAELRKIFDQYNGIPDEVLYDDAYFQDFKLQFAKSEDGEKNQLDGMKYSTLGIYKSNFEFMTMRCMAIRQNEPKEDDSSVFEIFSRLNTGGVNLSNQEIRACLYYSNFYRMLNTLNQNSVWRSIYGKPEDDKFRDIEILLRAFSLLYGQDNYTGTMNVFINRFAKKAMGFDVDEVNFCRELFTQFMDACKDIPREVFCTQKGALNAALFDCLFAVCAAEQLKQRKISNFSLDASRISRLKKDVEFEVAITHSTSHAKAVSTRLAKVREYLL